MGERHAFAGYHPAVTFIWFLFVIGFSMFFLHPATLVIAMVAAFAYAFMLKGKSLLRFSLSFLLPLLLLSMIINPLFNHRGMTVLFHLGKNAVTLEALIYGLLSALMLVVVITWFSCYNIVITADKFVYLFGRIIPTLSLIFSMTIGIIPRFIKEAKSIAAAQRCIGHDWGSGKLRQRIKQAARIVSILTTWSLENAITTADSMKSRGYGSKGRTSFALFRWESRDIRMLALLVLLGAFIIWGAASGYMSYSFFPWLKGVAASPQSICLFAAFAVLCLLPLLIELFDHLHWRIRKRQPV